MMHEVSTKGNPTTRCSKSHGTGFVRVEITLPLPRPLVPLPMQPCGYTNSCSPLLSPLLNISELSQAFDPILYIVYKDAVYGSLSTGIAYGEGQQTYCYLSKL